MKIQIAILTAAAAILHLLAPPAEAIPTWAQTFGVDYGTVGNDFPGDYPRSIVRMPDGGAVVGGYIFAPGSAVRDNVTYRGTFGESALVRYAADGSIIWKKVLGPFALNGYFVTPMVADPAGNIYVASGRPFDVSLTSGTPYVAKFSADGTLLWATTVKLPGPPDPNQGNATPYLNNFATSIILTSDGKVAVGGSYNPGGGGGHLTPYLVELSTAGQVLGAQWFENPHVQYSNVEAMAAGPNGTILFVTLYNTFILVDKDGKILFQRSYPSFNLQEPTAAINGTSDGGFIEVFPVGRFGAATVIRKLNADLTRQWEKSIYVDNSVYYGTSAEQTADGGYLIGARGRSSSNPHGEKALLTKLDANGVVQKIFAIGSDGFGDTGSSAVTRPVYPCVATATTDGGYAIAGPEASDWWIAKTDLTGKVRNYKGFMKDVTAEFKGNDNTGSITDQIDFITVVAATENAGSPQLVITDPSSALVSIQASPPRIMSAKTAEAVVGQHFAYHIGASFFDAGGTISYTATGVPQGQGFVFDAMTGIISGVPAAGSETVTPILITLSATDGSFSTPPFTLALTIGDGVPVFTVTETGIPSGAGPGEKVLSFAAKYPGKQAGRNVFVEVNEAGTWHPLPTGMDGHMTYDELRAQYVLNSTSYPLTANALFRARVTVHGTNTPILSNQIGPMNLAGSKPRAGQTVFHLNRNGVRADLDFIAEQTTTVAGVALRVQTSSNPGDEGSWADLSSSSGAGMTAAGKNRFSLLVNQYKAGEGVYFRVVASGSGLTDSLSNIAGPYTLQSNTPPKVTLKLPAPSGSNTGDAAHPLAIIADASGVAIINIDAQATAIGRTLQTVSILFDGDVIRTLTPAAGTISADYITSYQAGIGPHILEAAAIDDLGTTARAGTSPLYLNVLPSPNAAQAMSASGSKKAQAAFNPSKVFTVAKSGGSWDEPSTWVDQRGNTGIPGASDFVILGSSSVQLGSVDNVGSLSINGGHLLGPGALKVYTTLAIASGSMDSFVHLIINQGAVCELTNSADFKIDGLLDNLGTLKLHGSRGILGLTSFLNRGLLVFQDPLVASSSIAAGLPLDPRTISGGGIDTSGKTALAGILAQKVSVVSNDGNSLNVKLALITNDGGTVIRHGTGSLVSENGAGVLSDHALGVVSDDGASVIGQNGNNLITNDGGTLITNDGGTLITNDGGTLVGNSGGTLRGNVPGASLSNSSSQAETTTASGFTQSGGETDLTGISIVGPVTLNGGVLAGSGLIMGNVTNNGGYVSPGHSAGSLLVSGNYTQASGGTMVLEAGGGEAGQFDQVLVGGTASLAGRLDLRTINGYVPLPGDPFNPLGYKTVSGSFSSVSSNAQVALNSTGLVTTINPAAPNPPAGQPLNIATRMSVQTGDNVLIAGFIVTGPSGSTKKVLIRGLGPSLAQFGVTGTLSDPLLELHKSDGTVINDNWQQGDASQIPNGFAPSDPREAVIVATLTPGNYSAVVKGAHGETGIGIAELYDLDSASPAKLANISTRGFINTGDDVMIGGFIIGGTEPAKILVRAIGPTLTDFGVQGALADPTLELHDSNGSTVSNDDWRESQEAAIIATTIPPNKDREPAILATLVPGNYTAVVRGKNNTTGVGLVEAYNLQ